MFKKYFTNIFRPRSFWKTASFSEVGEVYSARLMRTIAVNLGTAFMTVYMFKTGYSIFSITMFWAGFYCLKVLVAMPFAQLIANIGPKKSIFISNFVYVPSMILFMFLPELGLLSIIPTLILQAVSDSLYEISELVLFSRASRHSEGGSSVAKLNMADKFAKGLTPLVGGLIAMLVDPRATIAGSILFFIVAALPLMRSKESMELGFKLSPKGFPWKVAIKSLVAQLPVGFDSYASGSAWLLFLAAIIFTSGGDKVYAELGGLTSLVLIVSIGATYMFGKLIDKKAGNQLIRWMVIGDSAMHVARALLHTPAMAVSTNATSEVAVTGYSMATMRGMFDLVDQTGYRVFFMGLWRAFINAGMALAAITLAIIVTIFETTGGFTIFYLLTAAIVISISFTKFRIYS